MTSSGQCCPSGSTAYLSPPSDYKAQGSMVDISGIECYVAGDPGAASAVLFIPDIYGFDSGRHRLIADALAGQGWIVYLVGMFQGNAPGKPDGSIDFPYAAKNFTAAQVAPIFTDKVIPYMKEKGAKKIAALGFCSGAYYMTSLGKFDQFVAGAACHPSLYNLANAFNEDPDAYVKDFKAPLMFLTAGSDRDEEKPNGSAWKILEENGLANMSHFETYGSMQHGWVPRGDSQDAEVSKEITRAIEQVQEFFRKFM